MADYQALALRAYEYAEQHYGDKDARFDVIVETMEKREIAAELEEDGVGTEAGAIAWAKRRAGLHFEQELNQAWDGPESVKSSSRYDPAHDPAGPPDPADFCPACGLHSCNGTCSQMDAIMREEMRHEGYVDSYTGMRIYTLTAEEMAQRLEQYDASDAPPYGNMF